MMNKKLKTAIRLLSKYNTASVSMLAICFKGSSVISWGVNKYKTIPLPSMPYRYSEGDGRTSACTRHAEINAIRRSKAKDIDTIIIVRLTKNGVLSKSMPCSMCKKYIDEHDILNVVYLDWDGKMKTEQGEKDVYSR